MRPVYGFTGLEPGLEPDLVYLVTGHPVAVKLSLDLVIAGPVSDLVGLQFWFLLSGAVCVLVGCLFFFVPAIVNIEENKGSDTMHARAMKAAE